MEKSILSFLRYHAFWKELDKQGLSGANPDVRSIEQKLSKDFIREFQLVKVIDVNLSLLTSAKTTPIVQQGGKFLRNNRSRQPTGVSYGTNSIQQNLY